MRNLKKILALVLALVMTMSVMSVASAAKAGTTYADDDSITNFDESIQVLTALGIFKGDDFSKIRPNDTITRAEAAALVYRVISTDVNDTQTKIYTDYNKFTDVSSDNWFAGYVNFCANGQYIIGNGDGTFNPYGNITGYQLLAIILRALGYGKAGEYQGNGWEITTATDARKLGITKNINESTLGQAQTRAAVAEMIFQGLTCTQTVNYTALLGYASTNVITSTVNGTLGYQNFGLRGQYASSDASTGTVGSDANSDAFVLSDLQKRADAVADTEFTAIAANAFVDTTFDPANGESVLVDARYGEPVAFWYADSIANPKTNPAGEIEIRFNAVSSYTVAVDEAALFADSGMSGNSTSIDERNNEDGASAADTDLYKSKAAKGNVDLTIYGGNGSTTELFVVDGHAFVVVKNTYADKVSQVYKAKYEQELALATDTLDAAAFRDQAPYADSISGLARNSVVIYNMYGGATVADIETVHTATSKTVTLTNSYVKSIDGGWADCQNSYFLVGSTKYEYDCKALETVITDDDGNTYELLDRAELLAADPTEDTQDVYFDDYGYVIWSEDANKDNAESYMIVTSTAYGGYDKDNGYYMNITGYDIDGKSVTVKGGFDTFVYNTSASATDYDAPIGIYHFETDPETGFVMLDPNPVDVGGDNAFAEGALMAGDPDGVDDYAVADSETVFVVANYSAKGAITGYDVYTGIKSVKDLKDAGLDSKSTVIYPADTTAWNVTSVDDDSKIPNGDGRIDLVLVLGAKQTTDVKLSTSIQAPEVFYLVDEVPEKQFAEYNLYTVIMDGKLTTLKVDVDAEGGSTGDVSTDGIFDQGKGFYSITAWAGEYVYSADWVEATEVEWVGADVLSIDSGNDSIWAYASCHLGEGDENGENAYITLADNCKLYDLTDGKVTEIAATDLAMDNDMTPPVNELGYENTNCVVGGWDSYGFATIIYVIDNT
jgi:hypothetical protein